MSKFEMTDNASVIQTASSCLKPIMTRRGTDVFFILLLPLNFLLWLGIGIYEIDMDPFKNPSARDGLLGNPHLGTILLRSLLNITIYTLVSLLIMILFLFVTSVLNARWIVFAAVALIVTAIVAYIMFIPWELIVLIAVSLNSHSLLFLIVALVATILYLIYQVTIFVCTKETNVNLTAELISRSCLAIRHSYPAVSISVAIAFLSIIVLMITVNISLSKMFDHFHWASTSVTYLDLLRLSIFFIGGIYIFNFIWNFGLIVMSDYFANFYASPDDEKLSTAHVSQSMSRISRYHLGTVALLSTPILPSICALTMAFKTPRKYISKSSYASISFFSKLCLIIDMSDYALVQTAINGYKTLKSVSEMLQLHQRNSLLFLTLNAISTKIIEICIVVATLVGMIIRIFSLPKYHDIPFARMNPINVTEDSMVYEVLLAAVYISFICKSATRSAMCTFSIYQMSSIRMSETLDDHIAIAEQSI